jgi:accessory gene regulator protein AgrB
LYKKAPWHSFIGVILSIIGAVYFVGVLGAFLSIPMGSVNITNILKISFMLCILVFAGNIVQGFALLKTDMLAKWQSVLFIVGNILILIFPGTENWMALGSLLMLIALFPLSMRIIKQHSHS